MELHLMAKIDTWKNFTPFLTKLTISEDILKNEDEPKNDDNLKNEDGPKIEEDLKYWEDFQLKW